MRFLDPVIAPLIGILTLAVFVHPPGVRDLRSLAVPFRTPSHCRVWIGWGQWFWRARSVPVGGFRRVLRPSGETAQNIGNRTNEKVERAIPPAQRRGNRPGTVRALNHHLIGAIQPDPLEAAPARHPALAVPRPWPRRRLSGCSLETTTDREGEVRQCRQSACRHPRWRRHAPGAKISRDLDDEIRRHQ